MKKLKTYQDFSQIAAELEQAGNYAQAESAWRQAAKVARDETNREWALNRREVCAYFVKHLNRAPEK